MDVRQTPTASIAIVSEDAELSDTVAGILSDTCTLVTCFAARGDSGSETFKTDRPDIVVLDRGVLDDIFGRIRRLRRRWPTIDIIVVNVLDETDVEAMLDAGADDAIVRESPLLIARLNARARRARTANAGARISVGDIVFDRESRRVWCAGQEVVLTPRECAMLDCLFWHAPQTVSMQTLADFVWKDAEETDRRGAVEVYIGYLRKKLAGSRSVVIKTVRQAGYQFAARE